MNENKPKKTNTVFNLENYSYAEEPFPVGNGICLDLGAGTGRMKNFIEKHGYAWIGLDCEKNEKLIVLGDAHNLPFRSGVFDLINMNAVLEHFHHPKKVMDEVYRVLKKKGILYGWVAFLEPFHGSFFHFTFRGLEVTLLDSGFIDFKIWAGPHVINSILQHTVPFMPPTVLQRIAKSLGEFHSKIGLYYMRFAKHSIDGIPSKRISTDDLLFKFSEGYGFYARK